MSARPWTLSRLLPVFPLVVAAACGGSTPPPTAPSTPSAPPASPAPAPAGPASDPRVWDVTANGIPRFVSRPYLDLGAIARISRFRSGEGHSYTDAFETCRSMKHYFQPRPDVDAAAIPIVAPIDGTVVRLDEEWAGTQIHIESRRYPAFRVLLFHVRLAAPTVVGAPVIAGQPLGTHIGPQTMSDVAVAVTTPAGFQLVSWFDVLDDAGFAQHAARGMASRDEAVIARAERDAHPLSCAGEQFADAGTVQNWISLR